MKIIKAQGSILSSMLIFLGVLSFLLLTSLKLSLMQTETAHLFSRKLQLVNQAESMLKLLQIEIGHPPIENVEYHLNLIKQDECKNQYLQIEIIAKDALAKAVLQALWIKNPTQLLPGCAKSDVMIYQSLL